MEINAYQLLSGGSLARLAVLRKVAADSVNNRNESTRLNPADWRKARAYKLNTYDGAFCQSLYQGIDQWYTHGGKQFRNEKDAHEVISRLPRGWYTDGFCDDTAIGIVGRLSHGRFIAGYRWTSNDERVYYPEIFTDETDAARAADGHAESFAESSREDSQRFERMAQAEDDVSDKILALEKAIVLRHLLKFGGVDRVIDAISELRKAREESADATADYERGTA